MAGRKDISKLVKKVITNVKGHKQTVYVKPKVEPYKYDDSEGGTGVTLFTTDKNTKYKIEIKLFDSAEWDSKKEEWIDKKKDWRMNVAFSVQKHRRDRFGRKQYDFDKVTNKGEMYRVMATVADIVKKELKERPQIKTIAFEPTGDDESDNRRLHLYLRLIKKYKPNAKVVNNVSSNENNSDIRFNDGGKVEGLKSAMSKINTLKDKKYKCSTFGECVKAADEVTDILDKHGIDYKVIEGYVQTNKEHGENHKYRKDLNHTWVELKNGKKIDVTISQFDKEGGIREYLGKDTELPPKNVWSKKEYQEIKKKGEI